MRFLDADGAAIAVVREEGGSLVVEGAEGKLRGARGKRVGENDPGLILQAISREEVQVTGPGESTAEELLTGFPIALGAAAPMRAHGMTIGALIVSDPRNRAFSRESIRLLSTVAAHTAVALANSKFFELIQRSKEQWETAFDALAEGVAVVDADNRIRRANMAFATLAKRSLPAVVGMPLAAALGHRSSSLLQQLEAARRGERRPALSLRSKEARRR